MTGRNLSRRLDRLEERLIPATEEPLQIVARYVSTDGDVAEAYRVTVPSKPSPLRHWQRR
jgi:hypothetical protein